MTDVFRTLIVPAGQQQLAQDVCAAIAPSGGAGMFTTGLSADGSLPASDYISTGWMDAELMALLPLTTFDDKGNADTKPGQPEVVVQLCEDAGLKVTQVQIMALFAAADCTEQDPFEAMARLGLTVANDEVSVLPA